MVRSPQNPLKVFIADDSRLIRDRVAMLLAAAHMVVVGEASTPAASIEGILSGRPTVVVLDVQLEGGTGLEVLRAVRSAAPEIAVIVFSNSAAPAYRKRYMSQGAAGFFDKSTEFDQLALAVANSCPGATS
jgi:DNA-binding NarL/FixJ family response regulator